MLQGLYNGLSGLLGFSKQLDNIGTVSYTHLTLPTKLL